MEKDTLKSFVEKACHDFAGILNYFTMADLDQKSDLGLLYHGTQKGAWLLQGYRFMIAGQNIKHYSLNLWIQSFEKITKSKCSFLEFDLEKVSLLVISSLMIAQESIKKGGHVIFETHASCFKAVFKDFFLRNIYVDYFKEKKNPETVPLLSILQYTKWCGKNPICECDPLSLKWIF